MKPIDATAFQTCICEHTADQHASPGNIGNRWMVHPLLGACRGCACTAFKGQAPPDGRAAILFRTDQQGVRALFPWTRRARLYFWLAKRLPRIRRALFWVFFGRDRAYADNVQGEW